MNVTCVAVIGGSGLYQFPELTQVEALQIDTPFGPPSSEIIRGTIGPTQVLFVARHGLGHHLMPTEINTRANIWALKSLGAQQLVSVSAVGSLREQVHPLDLVLPDQYIDRTRHRPDTFFGNGLVAHVSLAEPTCLALRHALAEAARSVGATVHAGGTYLCMEGPQFSTRAESRWFRSMGASVIGMTNMQEARLCREAELCFASICLVTDYDCWKEDEAAVTVEAIIDRLHQNAARARRTIVQWLTSPLSRSCDCAFALDTAIVTQRDTVPPATIELLRPLLARVLQLP